MVEYIYQWAYSFGAEDKWVDLWKGELTYLFLLRSPGDTKFLFPL